MHLHAEKRQRGKGRRREAGKEEGEGRKRMEEKNVKVVGKSHWKEVRFININYQESLFSDCRVYRGWLMACYLFLCCKELLLIINSFTIFYHLFLLIPFRFSVTSTVNSQDCNNAIGVGINDAEGYYVKRSQRASR